MTRFAFGFLVLLLFACAIPGCGSDPEFTATEAPTASEQEEAEDYMADYEKNQKEQYGN